MEPHHPDTLRAAERSEADDPHLGRACAGFPDWEITRHWDGYEAAPKGTTVNGAMFLDGLLERLRDRGASGERPEAS